MRALLRMHTFGPPRDGGAGLCDSLAKCPHPPYVYPGVDVVYHTEQQALEYDFLVAAGADPGFSDVSITKFSPGSPCTLRVTPRFSGGTLHLDFFMGTGTAEPVRWVTWLVTTAGARRLWSTWQPVIDPPQPFDVPVEGRVGRGWVDTRLVTADRRVVCSDRAAVDPRGAR